jgi:hypothetical protein
LAGLCAGQFHKGGEIPLHDVVEEAGNALIELRRVGQILESRKAHPATFEERRKPVLNDPERRSDLARPAPGIVEDDFSAHWKFLTYRALQSVILAQKPGTASFVHGRFILWNLAGVAGIRNLSKPGLRQSCRFSPCTRSEYLR